MDREAICQVQAVTGSKQIVSIHDARSALLSHLFAQPPTAFIATADSVRKCFEFAGTFNRPFGFRAENIVKFIYDPDAKARMLSLFLALATLVAGLTLFDAESRQTTLSILSANGPFFFGLWLAAVLLAIMLYGIAACAFKCLNALVEWLSRFTSARHEISPALVRYLVRDLVTYHAWLGPRLNDTMVLPDWAIRWLGLNNPHNTKLYTPFRHYMDRD